MALLEAGVDLDASGVRDVGPQVLRAGRGGILTGPELVDIASTLAALGGIRDTLLRRQEGCPSLARLARSIPDLTPLGERLAAALSPQGEVEDHASPALQALRGEARRLHQEVEEALRRLIHSPLGRHILQEPLITYRGGRPVLPLKAEFRGRLPGLVHDVSESGATLFVEPLPLVPLVNRWREAQTAVQREEERVLRSLSQEVGARADEVLRGVEAAATLDLVFAKARWARRVKAIRPALATGERPVLRLVDARHPLLPNPVPNTIEVGEGWTVLVITGPNAGGKTVTLKTAGLLALLHQCGIPIPAGEGSVLPVFDRLFVDIGDRQSIAHSLSTFAARLGVIREALDKATPRSLVLLDELGAGTDPEEGAALAKALLVEFRGRGVLLIATTHQREVAAFVQGEPGMQNGSLDLDPVTLAPTYRLTLGVPGGSWGLTIAQRLGLPPTLLRQAQAFLTPERRRLETLQAQVQQERLALQRRQKQLESALAEVRALRERLQREVAGLEEEKARLLEEARRRVQQEADALLARLAEARRALEQADAAAYRRALQQVQAVRREVQGEGWQSPHRKALVAALRPGVRVWVQGFPQPGAVLTPADAEGNLEVQVGPLRLRTSVDRIERLAEETPPPPAPVPLAPPPPSTETSPSDEIDVRGLRVEEALRRLDAFLDKALLRGHRWVRVVHGAGTGTLRAAVREHLRGHPLAASWKPDTSRPGDSATVVETA